VASPLYHKPPDPPGIYRAARALRRISTIVLVLVIVFVAIVAYSAVQVVKAKPSLGSSTTQIESNDTIGLSTSFSMTNPTYFAIQHFDLHFLIVNATGSHLIDTTVGPDTIPAGGSSILPIALFLPVSSSQASLLTQNQYLNWYVWGNASYAYLFTVSVGVATERSWGAPFDNLSVVVGAPFNANGELEVPITITFADDASFADDGNLDFQVVPPSGPDCAQGTFAVNVPAGSQYDQTQDVGIASGCDPSGGHVAAEYVVDGATVVLPSEGIP
jgi:hypothetical protein